MNEQLEFMKEIARRLDSVHIRYMLTGSVAMAVYTVPRMTRDIDLVIECCPEDAPAIAALFRDDSYVDEDRIRKAAAERSMFNIIHQRWLIKADFIVRGDNEYRRVEFSRRKQVDIGGMPIWIVAPEDLILSKLKWAKGSGSSLQERDVKLLLETVERLDHDYIRRWAERLGVEELLKRLEKR